MTLPRDVVRRLLVLMLAGYVVLAAGTIGAAFYWQERTAQEIRDGQARTFAVMIESQVDACERGNVIRRSLAEDNFAAIETTRDLLAGEGLSPDQERAYRASLDRRIERQGQLREFPCRILRFDPRTQPEE